MSQLQYRNENQNFISNFVFQFIKKAKWHFSYTDLPYRTYRRLINQFMKCYLNHEIRLCNDYELFHTFYDDYLEMKYCIIDIIKATTPEVALNQFWIGY